MDTEKEINLKYSICNRVCYTNGKEYRQCMVDCFNAVFVKKTCCVTQVEKK